MENKNGLHPMKWVRCRSVVRQGRRRMLKLASMMAWPRVQPRHRSRRDRGNGYHGPSRN